jgi:hypothetical protein
MKGLGGWWVERVKNPWKVVESGVYGVYWLPFPYEQGKVHGDQHEEGEGASRPRLVVSCVLCLRRELTELCSWGY